MLISRDIIDLMVLAASATSSNVFNNTMLPGLHEESKQSLCILDFMLS